MAFTFANHAGRAVLVDGNNFHDLEALSGGTIPSDPAAALAHGDKLHDLQKKTAGRTPEGTIDAAKLGAPSPTPQKVFGIGLNYKTHAAESNMEVPDNPVVFAKFSSCICAPNSNIELRSDSVDYEGEIVVIIGTPGKDISQADAWNHVFAITAGQDVSDRPVQMASKPPHFDLGKSFDTFGPIGPVAVSPDVLPNRDKIAIKCLVNGEERQNDTSANLIFGIPFLIEYLSHITTLNTGDVIFTGTPAGVGAAQKKLLRDGDIVTTIVDGVGTMTNKCVRVGDHNLPLTKKG
ncbi:MAG: fumarylacetoacetate hydrolase family protein [Actinomycetota bacterium]|jgi:2-keto-4-pentenoate hydratase/2-oxohepta-3-ene-1,7-dioic acid hydratase in catechol pathway